MSKVDAEEIKLIFEEKIWPIIKGDNVAQNIPKAYVLGGQPGAGKSNLLELAHKETGNNLVSINGDEFRQFHPKFKELKKMHGINAAEHTVHYLPSALLSSQ